ncbi:hypothetical protein MPSEU_000118400 [Mayamaea pseudoterrestris]|nr:hypothetical protein MPSEU_000118400 [Mayamaea pseudoterrestris]
MTRPNSKARDGFKKQEEKQEDGVIAATQAKEYNAKPSAVALSEADGEAATTFSVTTLHWLPRRVLPILAMLLQFLLLDCPVMLTFAAYYSTFLVERYYINYLAPQMDLQLMTEERKSRELTYFHRTCTVEDLTATDTPQLTIDYENMTPSDAMYHMLEHGASIYPNLLSEATASEVRDFILQQNEKNQDMIYVIENEHRWSFGVRVDQDPSIQKALHEILSNDFFVASLEKIVGPNPAVIEFTGITSAYGAKAQRYHADVVPEGNAAKWARTFVPSYSLFVPLQNVTSTMGATEICPGSHMCADGVFDYCPEHGFQVSGSSDHWALGSGALLNQQLMHRGEAHIDPNGPLRVLFIVTFAPRPRFGKFQLETRSLAQGGSYSLHWQQWGHTLRDLVNVSKHMSKPWRFLRSMGFWKPWGRHWGWDYVTTASARISNSEVGFHYHELLDMLKYNQFSWVPKHLHGNVPDALDDSRDIWVPFYTSTLYKCRKALEWIHVSTVASRLVTDHLAIYYFGELLFNKIEKSTYDKNLRSGRLFQWPPSPPHYALELPGTLPSNNDILIADDMQSEYMASYTEVLDVVHPGNKAWYSLIQHYTPGYDALASQDQAEQCSLLVEWSRHQNSRMLVKNRQNQWAVATQAIALRFCHKAMMKMANPYLRMIIHQLDSLRMETKFGYLRETQMHQRFIPYYLHDLQDRVLTMPSVKPLNKLIRLRGSESIRQMHNFLSGAPTLKLSKRADTLVDKLSTTKITSTPQSNFQVGEKVEAAYASLQTEWYAATIIGADAHTMTWDVVYRDGEKELSLCQACVRVLVPYEVDEDNVECRRQGETFFEACRVLAVRAHDKYDVQMSTTIEKSFEAKAMRRVAYLSEEIFELDDYVMAPFDDTGLYPGIIEKVNEDGTYGVRFEDGEVVPRIFGHSIVRLDDFEDEEDDDFDEDDDDADD